MAYLLNNVTIQTPTSCTPKPMDAIGTDGTGAKIYPSVYEFQLQWSAMAIDEYEKLMYAWSIEGTGTSLATLPDFGPSVTSYAMRVYSGTHLDQPIPGAYFEQYILNVTMSIGNVRLQ